MAEISDGTHFKIIIVIYRFILLVLKRAMYVMNKMIQIKNVVAYIISLIK